MEIGFIPSSILRYKANTCFKVKSWLRPCDSMFDLSALNRITVEDIGGPDCTKEGTHQCD
ncbi:hypothetical protein SLEP1_g35295 [Rubroshorea leprosula]|uniref:Uncharacterized protein n=1 Tax=Rubroshorea leprosula TaxID=152421 RepID=A0AAV5KN25_9ROSI|nr:hypothetical protein SLEP1_g35295 [Rubroshorea leprosula]